MCYENIKELVEVQDIIDANKYLSEGWVLLKIKIINSRQFKREPDNHIIYFSKVHKIYILGR